MTNFINNNVHYIRVHLSNDGIPYVLYEKQREVLRPTHHGGGLLPYHLTVDTVLEVSGKFYRTQGKVRGFYKKETIVCPSTADEFAAALARVSLI